MWWWNKEVDLAVLRKKEIFKIWKQNEEDRKKYCEAKKDAKRVVFYSCFGETVMLQMLRVVSVIV